MSDSTVRARLSRSFEDMPAYNQLTSMVIGWADGLKAGAIPTELELRGMVQNVANMLDFAGDLGHGDRDGVLDSVTRELLTRVNTTQTIGEAVASYYRPWIGDAWADAGRDWEYWNTYKRLLQKQGRPPKMLTTLEEDVKNILELVGDPREEGHWQRRGLVMGDVQSGKTSNFVGLMNMAADAGYRLFVVVGGHTEDLRSQTQDRVDEGFIGRRSIDLDGRNLKGDRLVGVGPLRDRNSIISVTTTETDFVASSRRALQLGDLDNSVSAPVVLVVKKNSSILKNLAAWLKKASNNGVLELPTMFIDDESDYASVNTNKKDQEEATAVNRAIRSILETSQRSTYIGFTATPFANVLTDPSSNGDLFPRHFVYSLYAPNNYSGAKEYFENNKSLHARNQVEDAEGSFPFKHKSTHKVPQLPDSLLEAIDAFIVSCAVTNLRGGIKSTRSMLVNVSRFKGVQRQVHDLVEEHVESIASVVRNVGAAPARDDQAPEAVLRLRDAWAREYADLDYSWEEVFAALPDAAEVIEAELVNGDTAKQRAEGADARARSHSDRGRRYIAVGGAILSRGLTLEGLVVSYFYQRTQLSDTLLQMGRWFGYRDSYKDLVRIWLPLEVMEWFLFTAEALEDIRKDVSRMRRLEMTPEDFGLKIQKHPEALKVTAANKMRHADSAEVNLAFDKLSVETKTAAIHEEAGAANRRALLDLVVACENEMSDPGLPAEKSQVGATSALAYSRVGRLVVEDFFSSFVPGPVDTNFARNSLTGSFVSDYVRSMNHEEGEIWDVVVISGEGSPVDELSPYGKVFANQRNQANLISDSPRPHIKFANSRVASGENLVTAARSLRNGPDSRWADVLLRRQEELLEEAVDTTKKRKLSESEVLQTIDRPILLVYPIQARRPNSDLSIGPEDGVLGLKLAFPALRDELGAIVEGVPNVRYVVNQIWLREAGLDSEDRVMGDEERDE
ncbi:Z1 domain-containing protein [Nesterenkonia sandarakina]